ncbi:MAG: hypothetical protein L3J42_00825 [Hydrogenimonas sp.]|nr:hypothetical protein [Hydrogenimonas sp.]
MKEKKINKIERLKLSLNPYYYKERLDTLKVESLEESDRFYLKNFGIYNHKLRPQKFILRVRISGGRLSFAAFSELLKMARYADSRVIVTSRAQIELHDLDLETALKYMKQVEELGLTSWQTYTDNIRNIVTDPLDGIGEDSLIEVYGAIKKMERIFLKRVNYTGMLPRKFNVAINGSICSKIPFFGNDLYFLPAEKDGEIGFKAYVGGKNGIVAKDLDIFCFLEDVPDLFEAVVESYMEYGLRASRTKSRLFHLIEDIGLAKFRSLLLRRYDKEPIQGGVPLFERFDRRGSSFILKDGKRAMLYRSRFGELEQKQAEEIVEICEEYGVEELRLGCDQNIYIPGLLEDIELKNSFYGYSAVTVCAGSKYCVYSLFDTKEESGKLQLERAKRMGVTIGFSGCLKGCARHALSDIGFVGIRTGLYGEKAERGVRLYLGAEYTRGKSAGRLILYAVPLRCINRMIELILSIFQKSGFENFEEFSARVLNRYSSEALAFWLLLNYYRMEISKKREIVLPEQSSHSDEKGYFAKIVKEDSIDEERELAALLEAEEEFPFREAIIYLEKASFAVR